MPGMDDWPAPMARQVDVQSDSHAIMRAMMIKIGRRRWRNITFYLVSRLTLLSIR